MAGTLELTGIVPVYKPKGITSHDVIDILRKRTGVRRIGHAGTLDPLASGVLVIGIGREATKKLHLEVAKEKEYLAEVTLGVTSSTDDAEGEKQSHKISHPPTLPEVSMAVAQFKGDVTQVPPIFSAAKLKGEAAYKLARKGKVVELKPRNVEIKNIQVLDYSWPKLTIKVVTGPGVYIRSLARDIGEVLGTGGYVSELERIRVGEFTVEDAVKLN
ncbi:MAG: tRNA pseudouridine(55) synthase TruB [Patescibacteria group bacterium]|jgi:tRNA pseudouridine55 synthase